MTSRIGGANVEAVDASLPGSTPAVGRAAVLLGLEGAALLAVGVVFAVATAAGSPTNRGLSFTVAGFAVGAGVVLGLLGRSVSRLRGWARSPSVVLQLLAFPVGVGLLQGGVWAAGVPVLLVAGATLWHLIASGRAFAD
ncbi:MAG: hypothetical protein NVSMB55_03800 [Mycobacteriales bacterium]